MAELTAQLTLRTLVGRSLTNQEVDDNFTSLNADIIAINTDLENVKDVVIPTEVEALELQIAAKQNLNAKLTSLSSVSTDGILTVSGNNVVPRNLVSDTPLLTITNGDGAGNPTFDLSDDIVTVSNIATLTNKTISGLNNTITNVSLSSGVTGILPVSLGGTNANNEGDARVNLGALRDPGGTGLVVRTGVDSTTTRFLAPGPGIVITNETGITNNPTIEVDPDLIDKINSVKGGATGAQGPAGATGVMGASGLRGFAGAQGPIGATGPAGSAFFPTGIIVMWSGSSSNIPSGWLLCNGSNGTPDLRNRFVIGAGSSYSPGNVGGSKDAIVVAHNHSASSTFSGVPLGSHTHSVTDPGHVHQVGWRRRPSRGSPDRPDDIVPFDYPFTTYPDAVNSAPQTTGVSIAAATSGTPVGTVSTTVNLTGSNGVDANLPPYYALCFIMKV